MCNACYHKANCECEFGPPYHKKIEIVKTVPWIDQAVGDQTSFKRALSDLRIEPKTRQGLLRDYRTTIGSGLSPQTLRTNLKALLSRLEYRIEGTQVVRLRVPLFRFYSPLPGAEVAYRENLRIIRRLGWLVNLQGLGMGATKEVRFTSTSTFKAVDGDWRQVFLPLDVTVHLVGVYDKAGHCKGRGLRAELKDFKNEKTLRARGDEPLTGVHPSLTASGPCDQHYDLQRSSGVTDHLVAKEFDLTRDLQIGLNCFGFKVEMPASVRREREIVIESSLPSGHDYQLWIYSDALQWRVDEDVPAVSRANLAVPLSRRASSAASPAFCRRRSPRGQAGTT